MEPASQATPQTTKKNSLDLPVYYVPSAFYFRGKRATLHIDAQTTSLTLHDGKVMFQASTKEVRIGKNHLTITVLRHGDTQVHYLYKNPHRVTAMVIIALLTIPIFYHVSGRAFPSLVQLGVWLAPTQLLMYLRESKAVGWLQTAAFFELLKQASYDPTVVDKSEIKIQRRLNWVFEAIAIVPLGFVDSIICVGLGMHFYENLRHLPPPNNKRLLWTLTLIAWPLFISVLLYLAHKIDAIMFDSKKRIGRYIILFVAVLSTPILIMCVLALNQANFYNKPEVTSLARQTMIDLRDKNYDHISQQLCEYAKASSSDIALAVKISRLDQQSLIGLQEMESGVSSESYPQAHTVHYFNYTKPDDQLPQVNIVIANQKDKQFCIGAVVPVYTNTSSINAVTVIGRTGISWLLAPIEHKTRN